MAHRMHLLVSGREFVGASKLRRGLMTRDKVKDLDSWSDVFPVDPDGESPSSWILFQTDSLRYAIRRESIDAFWTEEHSDTD